MRKMPAITAFTVAAMTIAGSAFAQSANPTMGAATTTPATHNLSATGADTTNSKAPSDRNPILTDNGDARASKVIGSSVYNDHNDKVGSIDDIVIPKQGGQVEAILSVGGFLGIGSKYVAVPYNNLKFGNTNASSDNKVVLTGATKDSLMGMGSYSYTHNS